MAQGSTRGARDHPVKGWEHSEIPMLRTLLWHRDDGLCYLCGGRILDPQRRDSCNIDHIIPRSLGGTSRHTDNLALTHISCNTSKGSEGPPQGLHRDRSIRLYERNNRLPLSLHL